MISLLKKLYKQNEFSVDDKNPKVLFSEKKDQEYYITALYNLEEINNFFQSDKTNNIISFFEELKNTKADIKKNSSMIICLKVANFDSEYSSLKNLIFRIEEDEYFFRKYVIAYTEESIKHINIEKNINKQIHCIIKENNMMEEYRNNCYFNEKFFLAMQLFIKLPFVVYEGDDKSFTPLGNELNQIIDEKGLKDIYNKIINFEDYFAMSTNNYFDELSKSILIEKDDDEIINKFLQCFKEIEK